MRCTVPVYLSVFCFHMSAQKPDLYCSIRSNRDRLGFSVEIQIISDTAQMGKDIRGACGTKQRWLNNEIAYASFKDFSTCPQSINWMICRPTKYSLLLTKLANISSGRKVGWFCSRLYSNECVQSMLFFLFGFLKKNQI